MRPRYLQVGKLLISLTHLKCLRREELEQWVGAERAAQLLAMAKKHMVLLHPLYAELSYPGGRLLVSPGLTLVVGEEFKLTPEPIAPEARLDEEFLWDLLIELPRRLEARRAPVLVEDLDERFTRHVNEGILYALDIMERVANVYRVPFVVTGAARLFGMWSWLHTILRVYDKRGGSLLLVDGQPVVVG
ncbi:MAG: hypothetical protein DRK00_00080 [Thermoprotei archaeon]|nr:MAG: hypothetical protein DRK00_00080 [Thermoprotei archaeon]